MIDHTSEHLLSRSVERMLSAAIGATLVGSLFALAHYLYAGGYSDLHVYGSVVASLLYLLVSNRIEKKYYSQVTTFASVMASWLVTGSILLLFAYATKTSAVFSRVAVGGWIILTPFLVFLAQRASHLVFAKWVIKDRKVRVAVAGCGKTAKLFINRINDSADTIVKILAIYRSNEDCEELGDSHSGLIRGDLAQLIVDAKSGIYDEVYIALPARAEEEILYLIGELSDCSIPVYIVPDILTANLLTSKIYTVGGMPLVGVYAAPMDGFDFFLKRAEDLILSSIILAVLFLPMILIAVAIRIESPGPVIFKQRRYGLKGEEIEVWKFRSMSVCDNGGVITQATKNDPRITRIGSILRKTSLDELPQFFNVIQGTMSIVGPRPHAVAHNELYRKTIEGYMLRHLVKPGITGWAQINGWRGETDTLEKMEMRVKCDLDYIKNWSLWFDIKIIAITIIRGFVHKNAY